MARGGQGEGTRPGAEALARAAQDHGAEVVFANPGTTEMHLVGALDAPGLRLRPVLGLHETVSVFSPRAFPSATAARLAPAGATRRPDPPPPDPAGPRTAPPVAPWSFPPCRGGGEEE